MEHPNENDDSAVEDILPTIVTNSPTSSSAEVLRTTETDDTNIAIGIGNSQGNNDTAFEPPWEVSSRSNNNNYPICATRASGQVCICELCEAARLRLLHRRNRSDATETQAHTTSAIFLPNNKRSRDDDYDDTDANDINDIDDSITKTPRTLQSGSINTNSNTFNNSSIVTSSSHQDPDQLKLQVMSNACRTILQCIGEDPDREGLQKTPERWAKALLFLCHGYNISPNEVTNNAIFCENHNEMVVVRNIDIHSLCEHHMVPFTGHVHIGYIPNGKIIGLSKLARLADLFARRLQVQERLTRQIADSIVETIAPLGVAVVMECTHYCMVMRGVQKTGTITTTSSVRGCFETNSKTRAEFFSILHGGK